MDTATGFFERYSLLIYFVYGLAFFSLGLAVLLETAKASEMRLVRALRPLAVFGLMHGIHEWGDMFQSIYQARFAYVLSTGEEMLRHLWLAGSFGALIIFGMLLLEPEPAPAGNATPALGTARTTWMVPLLLGLVWLAGLAVLQAALPAAADWLKASDVWARYSLGIPGGLLAAAGLVKQQRAFRLQGLAKFGRDSLWAALAFGWYGLVGQLFPQPSLLFPSTVLNSDLFLRLFGFPVQLLRSVLAITAAFFILRFLRAFDFERARRIDELKEAQLRESEQRETLRRDLLRRTVTAQEAERQRIARELHDETGQSLTALGLGLRSIKSSLRSDPRLAERHAGELENLAVRSLDELRRLISDLRPSQLDDLGLAAALRWYGREIETRANISVEIVTDCPRLALPTEMNTVLFRIAQEALTNVVKHAQARHATVRLSCDRNGRVRLSIWDDGRGFDLEAALSARRGRAAWGLLGMQERADLIGGHLDMRSIPGKGTEVTVSVEVEPNKNGQNQTAAG